MTISVALKQANFQMNIRTFESHRILPVRAPNIADEGQYRPGREPPAYNGSFPA